MMKAGQFLYKSMLISLASFFNSSRIMHPVPAMTTAFLLTGFLRSKERSRRLITQQILAYPGSRLFVATWDITNIDRAGLIDKTPVASADVCDFYHDIIADVSIRNYDLFARSTPRILPRTRPYDLLEVNPRAQHHGTAWMERLFSQWLIVRDGLRMIAEYERRTGETFDMICRMRSDFPPTDKLPHWPQDRVLVSRALPGGMAEDQGWMPDFFLMGPASEMQKLADLCYSIEPFYDRQNLDTSNAEALLMYYMAQKDIPLAIRDVPIERL